MAVLSKLVVFYTSILAAAFVLAAPTPKPDASDTLLSTAERGLEPDHVERSVIQPIAEEPSVVVRENPIERRSDLEDTINLKPRLDPTNNCTIM